jgi:enterochelin esterase-like enzyme
MTERTASIITEEHIIDSIFLEREVIIDFYMPVNVPDPAAMSLLLINDGQDLRTMKFEEILEQLYDAHGIAPLLCVAIHCGPDRREEYATAIMLDYKGRGTKSPQYNRFIFEELLPFLRKTIMVPSFKEKSFAGFSMGGLSALDIVWNHPEEFSHVGVFSGSLWWRDKSQDDATFNESTDRIMHRQVREGNYAEWLRFFFEVGTLDETADRNKNGIIDSIDDTMSLIDGLVAKGYDPERDIKYLELSDGKHDVATWAKALPEFLKWAFPLI